MAFARGATLRAPQGILGPQETMGPKGAGRRDAGPLVHPVHPVHLGHLGQKEWARPDGRGFEAIRCLAILIVRHLWDAVVVPAQEMRGGGTMDAEERLDLIAAAICATEALMQKNLPLTLKALARHYMPGGEGGAALD